jgi:4-hydroxy-2-oxoheptanedioate aldolase
VRKNKVKERWRRGEPSVGSWLSLGNPLAAEIMAHIGFDWLTVDMEHNAIDIELTQSIFQAIGTTETVPFARVPWNDPQIIKRVLDIGAYGVVIPNVLDREEAERAVGACRYPPQGFRGIGTLRGYLYGGIDYPQHANEEIAVICMIEHIDAVGRAEEIMSTPGLDAVFIGPNDLAASMGVPLGLDNPHPEHRAAVARVLETGKRLGVPAGIHCGSVEAVNERIAEGFLWLALSSDAGLLSGAAGRAYQQVKVPAREEKAAGPGELVE